MKVHLDEAVMPPEDWAKQVGNAQCIGYDEAIGVLLVSLMGAGRDPDEFDVWCGRQMLMWLSQAARVPVRLDGVPSVSFYTAGGAVTAREDKALGQEDIEFRLRPPAPQPCDLDARDDLLAAAIAVRARRMSSKLTIDREDRRALDRLYSVVEALDVQWFDHVEPSVRIAVISAPRDITATGAWRVYFHRANPDGLPWCVAPDAGGWEIAVRSVDMLVPSEAVHRPKATPDDEDGKPSAWIAVTGTLTVSADGRATIRGSERST